MSYKSFMEWYRKEYPYHNKSGERYKDMLSAWNAAVNNFPQENIEPKIQSAPPTNKPMPKLPICAEDSHPGCGSDGTKCEICLRRVKNNDIADYYIPATSA